MLSLNPEYKERPMAPELDLVSRMHGRFKGTGLVMPESQKKIYKNITKFFVEDVKNYRGFPKIIHRPTVVDVGCGVGIGTNILSQEAEFAWGIDTNAESIGFATQCFERLKNNIYYTPQVTFDVVDVTAEPRELQAFDYVVCVEVIEHIPSNAADQLVNFLKRLAKKEKNGSYMESPERTKIFITTPNRTSPKLQKDTPFNEHHTYEATAVEMYVFLIQHFKYVTVYDENFETQELNTEATPLVFKLECPINT